jgi:hypothetical protein
MHRPDQKQQHNHSAEGQKNFRRTHLASPPQRRLSTLGWHQLGVMISLKISVVFRMRS